jgi:PadR family transcriptional regulator, regulatory protein AphA
MSFDIKTICLGALSLGDATGYEIRKQFEEGPFAYFYDASFGSIYPALNKLLADGLVTCTSEAHPGRPTKKIYSLTASGEAALRAALSVGSADHKVRSDFLAILFFAHLVDPAQRVKVYDAYCAFYRTALAKLADAVDCDEKFGHQLVQGFGVHVYTSALDYLERNREQFLQGDMPVAEPRRAVGK